MTALPYPALLPQSVADARYGVMEGKAPCALATTAALPANTYANGTAGVGATLTGNANAALGTIDGVAPSAGDRILVKNEATTSHNGVYTVTALGNGSTTPYVLTRASDADASASLGAGILVTVEGTTGGHQGTVNDATVWVSMAPLAFVTGTSALTFARVGVTGALLAANNLSDVSDTATALANLGVLPPRAWTNNAAVSGMTPSASANTYGSGNGFGPDGSYTAFALVLAVTATFTGIAAGETVTLRLRANYSNGSTADGFLTMIANGTASMTPDQLSALHQWAATTPKRYMQSVTFAVASSIPSSAASVTIPATMVTALEVVA